MNDLDASSALFKEHLAEGEQNGVLMSVIKIIQNHYFPFLKGIQIGAIISNI